MRRAPRFTIALIGTVLASMMGMAAVEAASNDESSFVSKINAERSSRGLATLRWNEDLAVVARRHSKRMADEDNLYHNPNLRYEVDGWEVLGENVGYGPSVNDLHDAFMASAGHRANILDNDYTQTGVGTVWRNGTLWVTEVFMRPTASSSGSGSSSRPRTTTSRRRTPAKPKAARPAKQPALPPRKPVAPVAAPPSEPSAAADLTRLMVANLLIADEPAVGSIGVAEMFVAPIGIDDEAELAGVTFRPFSRMVGRVNRRLITGSEE